MALGVFDGVHRAHRHILREAVLEAKRVRGTAMAVTFWPHPQKKESLYSLEHRLNLVKELGITVAVVIKFTKSFSRLSDKEFVKNILIKKIGVYELYVGSNFKFGRGASGDVKLLRNLSRLYNFRVKAFEVMKKNHRPVSSTYIRQLIVRGDLLSASALLERPVTAMGTVVQGDCLGRKLGFPTANINPHHEILPPSGIYAVRIKLDKRIYGGACYIGRKPTFKRSGDKSVEAYIFDFHKNIYGKIIEIQFIRKIREDRKFNSSQSLIGQIKKDISLARKLASAA